MYRDFHFDEVHIMCLHFIACVFSNISKTIATFNITKICCFLLRYSLILSSYHYILTKEIKL